MSKEIWVAPDNTRVLAGRFPLSVLLSTPPSKKEKTIRLTDHITAGVPQMGLKTSFHDLVEEGYTVMAYSQGRPASGCMNLVGELKQLLEKYGFLSKKGIVFITHSRGGLVARKALEILRIRCIALITLSTPHHGSSLARLAGMLSGFSRVLYPFFENAEGGAIRTTMMRVTEFLKSDAIHELLPGSEFIRSLDDRVLRQTKTLSIGGTDPTLLTLYRLDRGSDGYERLFSVPQVLTSFIPEGMLPEELIEGRGDGLVAAESSVAPHAVEHHSFPLNHAGILFDPRVRETIKTFVRNLILDNS